MKILDFRDPPKTVRLGDLGAGQPFCFPGSPKMYVRTLCETRSRAGCMSLETWQQDDADLGTEVVIPEPDAAIVLGSGPHQLSAEEAHKIVVDSIYAALREHGVTLSVDDTSPQAEAENCIERLGWKV